MKKNVNILLAIVKANKVLNDPKTRIDYLNNIQDISKIFKSTRQVENVMY